MCLRYLIFGGTTEGRELAEFCNKNNIPYGISVATDFGAALLPENTNVYSKRLDISDMTKLIAEEKYTDVIDATHPYAREVTENIKKACEILNIPYYRLLRKVSEISYGKSVTDINKLIDMLNENNSIILSTLGSKSLKELKRVNGYYNRIWIRVLEGEKIRQYCKELGFDENKIISEKGPFSLERNIEHLKLSKAKILITKESGSVGGYPEKVESARRMGIDMITISRPEEMGFDFNQIKEIIKNNIKK